MVATEGIVAVYMMASRKHGVIYTGVTSDLARRAFEHRESALPGFTKRHRCDRLVWYEIHERMIEAIQRERSVKSWPRDWKCNLIERGNPDWGDLYPSLI